MAIVANRPAVWNREVRVIERRIQPAGRRVARIASGRVSGRNVIGHLPAQGLRAQPSRLMAPVASGVR